MMRILLIFAYVSVLIYGLGIGANWLESMRGDESDAFYGSGSGMALGVGSSALDGAILGMVLGPIAGLILGCGFGALKASVHDKSALDGARKGIMLGLTLAGARKGMILGLVAGLILGGAYGAYNEYGNFKDREPIIDYGGIDDDTN
jgi:hypothetical protein